MSFPVDAIILATGYRMQIGQVPFLAQGIILKQTYDPQWLSQTG